MSVTSRDFNQDAARAKKGALNGPVFITDRGRPAHVLLSIEEYQRLTGKGRTLADLPTTSRRSIFTSRAAARGCTCRIRAPSATR